MRLCRAGDSGVGAAAHRPRSTEDQRARKVGWRVESKLSASVPCDPALRPGAASSRDRGSTEAFMSCRWRTRDGDVPLASVAAITGSERGRGRTRATTQSAADWNMPGSSGARILCRRPIADRPRATSPPRSFRRKPPLNGGATGPPLLGFLREAREREGPFTLSNRGCFFWGTG